MLIAQNPYKKKVRLGDVFALQFEQGFVFGQVVAQNVPFAGFDSCQHKVAIFKGVFESTSEWRQALQSPLLIAPYYINNLGFSRGYMPVVGNDQPVKLKPELYCYQDWRKGLVDEAGSSCARRPLVGEYGFGNYLTLAEFVAPCI